MSQTGSDSSDEADDVSPPWGAMAVEKFLLERWDSESMEDADEQRIRLVREFVKGGPQRASPDVTRSMAEMNLGQQFHEGTVVVPPTSSQIASILRPWRTLEQRDLAVDRGIIGCLWLRTCYKEGTDAQHEALVANIDMDMAVDERLLNDATLYDFGDHWEQILDYVPELVTNTSYGVSWDSDRLREAVDSYRKADRVLSGSTATADIEGAPMHLINEIGRYTPATEGPANVLKCMQEGIHQACVVTYAIIEDGEALETGLVALLFLDDCGRVVRRTRMCAIDAVYMAGGWLDGCWEEDDLWLEADLGEEYQEGGVCGGLLYFKPGS